MIKSLYIHIPFCDNICPYCDFVKLYKNVSDENKYIDKLIEEISSFNIDKDQLETIFIGGGTPTALSIENLDKLLSYLASNFVSVKEFSIETNPERITEDVCKLFKKYKVNRVSIGAQAANEKSLKTLGRVHTVKQIVDAFNLLKKHYINNINLDFIYGFNEMDENDIYDDIKLVSSLKPTHVSCYALQIEDKKIYKIKHITSQDDETLAKEYNLLTEKLSSLGYKRYEVSNYSLPGYECKHNLTYWHDDQYYAAGISASSYIYPNRYKNTSSITNYLKGINNKEVTPISKKDEEFEFLMLNLRLIDGFELNEFKNRFNKDFLADYKSELTKLKTFFIVTESKVKLRQEFIYLMDGILLDLLRT